MELAKKVGVKQASISEIETGESKSPRGTNLVALAKGLTDQPGLARGWKGHHGNG